MAGNGFVQPLPFEVNARFESLIFVANGHVANERWDAAFDSFRASYELLLRAQQPGHRFHKGLPLHNMGLVRLFANDFEAALKYTLFAFIEDALSRGEESPDVLDELSRPAAENLRNVFRLPNETLQRFARRVRTRPAEDVLVQDPAVIAVEEGWVAPAAPPAPGGVTPRQAPGLAGATVSGPPASVTETINLPFVALGGGEFDQFVHMLEQTSAARTLRISAAVSRGMRPEHQPSLNDVLAVVPAGSILELLFEGSSPGATTFSLLLPLANASDATLTCAGPIDDVAVLQKRVTSFLGSRKRPQWAVALANPVVRLALSGLAVLVTFVLTSRIADKLSMHDVRGTLFQGAAIGLVCVAVVLSFVLDLWGKASPRVLIPGWGGYDVLRRIFPWIGGIVLAGLIGYAVFWLLG